MQATRKKSKRHPKPTPGPWTAIVEYGDGRLLSRTEIVVDANRQFVALCDEDLAKHPDERIANAHLIAAAPDLLSVCEELLPHIMEPNNPFPNVRLLMSLREKLQVAITKATGVR